MSLRDQYAAAPKPKGIAARALAASGQGTSLARYDAACRAIAEAMAVDEVKEIRNQAEAMRAYAKQAENKQLEADAAEIRIRATRRIGELMAAQRDAGMMSTGTAGTGNANVTGGVKNTPPAETPITLAEVGIDKNLAKEARALAAIPEAEFNGIVGEWRERIEQENERVSVNLLKAGDRAQQSRRENDFYPTPDSLIAEIVRRWKPRAKKVWEPCVGDGRVATALGTAGFEVITGDIATGTDFFSIEALPESGIALCTNPPFERLREFIDHAFALGIQEMCLVLPERVWASGIGREQFERHRPSAWANMDWREDYLGKGGSPDRALAVAIWNGPCAKVCTFDVWSRDGAVSEESQAKASEDNGRISGGAAPVTGEVSRLASGRTDADESGQQLSVSSAPSSAIESGDSASDAGWALSQRYPADKPILRPHCLNREVCGGVGTKHCYQCLKAAGLTEKRSDGGANIVMRHENIQGAA